MVNRSAPALAIAREGPKIGLIFSYLRYSTDGTSQPTLGRSVLIKDENGWIEISDSGEACILKDKDHKSFVARAKNLMNGDPLAEGEVTATGKPAVILHANAQIRKSFPVDPAEDK